MTDTARPILFSVTAVDCDWSYTRGTGAGGQKKNKTSSAVHCTHRASGAHGYAEETRSQATNKQRAFVKMAETPKFKAWHRAECMRRNGTQAIIDAEVSKLMRPHNFRIECKGDDGRWQEWRE